MHHLLCLHLDPVLHFHLRHLHSSLLFLVFKCLKSHNIRHFLLFKPQWLYWLTGNGLEAQTVSALNPFAFICGATFCVMTLDCFFDLTLVTCLDVSS